MKQEIIRIDLKGVNCYLGKSEDSFVLFDTGGHLTMDKEYTDRKEELVKALEQVGCRPGNLKAIVLTHGDNDHVANAAFLREKYHTIIAMHEKDVELVTKVSLDKMMESFQYKSILLKLVFCIMKKPIRRITARTLEDYIEFTPDVLLKEGDDLSSYGFEAKILHLPGHTKGSIGIITEEGALIAGDTFANFKTPAMAMNASDFTALKNSIQKVRTRKVVTIYPGHGEPFEAKDLKAMTK